MKFAKMFLLLLLLIATCNTNVVNATTMPTIGEAQFSNSATFSPDAAFLATGVSNETTIWHAKSLEKIQTFQNVGADQALFFDKQGDYLYALSDNQLSAIHFESGEVTYQFASPSRSFTDAVLNDDDDVIYIVEGVTLYYIDALTGEVRNTFSLSQRVESLAFNEVTGELAIASANGDISIRNGKDGSYVKTIPYSGKPIAQSATFIEYDSAYSKLYFIHTNTNEYTSQLFVFKSFDVNNNYAELYTNESGMDLEVVDNFLIDSAGQFVFILGKVYDYYSKIPTVVVFDTISNEVVTQFKLDVSWDEEIYEGLALNKLDNRLFGSSTLYDIQSLPKRQFEKMVIQPEKVVMDIDEFQTLKAFKQYTDGAQIAIAASDVKWTTSNANIIRFVTGKLNAVSAGEATVTATYDGMSATQKIVVRDYIEHEPVNGVEADKTWTVEFNQPVNVQTIKEKNIYITNEQDEIVPVLYYVEQQNAKNVQLIPAKRYESGKTYTLWIKNVQSSANVELDQFVKKSFTIQ